MRYARLIATLVCVTVMASCSSARGTHSPTPKHGTVVSRSMLGVRVGLSPILDGGSAGWCIVLTSSQRSGKHNGDICTGARPSTGPVFIETCSGSEKASSGVVLARSADVVVLTRHEVAAVSLAGGMPIPTESSLTLPAELRAAAIELPGYKIATTSFTAGYPWLPCPRVTPLAASGKPINTQGRSSIPLSFRLPRREWVEPARSPSNGVCELTSDGLPQETVASYGVVALSIRPFPELLGRAFISCAETIYIYQKEHDLSTAVLLDATRPGAAPPSLPGMKPLAGHPSIFTAPPDMFARRIRGAWLVVKEEEDIGSSVPVALLEHLRGTIRRQG